MPKYHYTITREVVKQLHVEIDAENHGEASRIVKERYDEEHVDTIMQLLHAEDDLEIENLPLSYMYVAKVSDNELQN